MKIRYYWIGYWIGKNTSSTEGQGLFEYEVDGKIMGRFRSYHGGDRRFYSICKDAGYDVILDNHYRCPELKDRHLKKTLYRDIKPRPVFSEGRGTGSIDDILFPNV